MLQKNITTKQELMKLLQAADIKKVMAKDIHVPDDLNEVKKSAVAMLRSSGAITVFIVAS